MPNDARSGSTPTPNRELAPARVLVVEDNSIIALDTQEILLGLGVAHVDVAGATAAALALIDRACPEFALLDFNLGGETSEPVAQALEERAIPFAFATGYGDLDEQTGDYRQRVAVLLKPYSKDDLANVLRQRAA